MKKGDWNLTILLVLGCAALSLAGGGMWMPPRAMAAEITGTGSVSGTVAAPVSFQAAQVYIRNLDKDVLYMVYTANGQYRAINLLPGNYEINVRKSGLTTTPRQVAVGDGTELVMDFTMTEGSPTPEQQAALGGSIGDSEDALAVTGDQLFPSGPGLEPLENTCLGCHGQNFFGLRQFTADRWREEADRMVADGYLANPLDPQVRESILAYLGLNFGPDKPTRIVQPQFPLDEEALGRAMYIEYYLPVDPAIDLDGARRAQEPHIDDNGNVWFTERSNPNRIGMVDPRTAEVTDYVLPDPQADPHGLTIDAFGDVWWAETDGWHLGRLNPDTGEMTRLRMSPSESVVGRGHTPVIDSRQNIWFTTRDFIFSGVEDDRDGIGKWDRESGLMSLYYEPTPDSRPYGITVDVNDNVWTALSRGCGVARFDPETGEWTEFFANTPMPCAVRRLGVNSDASTVWFGIYSHGRLGKVDVASGEVTEYDIPMPSSQPYDAWPDPDDNVWVSDGGQGGTLMMFDPEAEEFTYYPSPQFTDMPKLDIGSNGAIWYTPRSSAQMAVGVLYPDMSEMTTLAAVR
jgi:virginiamycin B lyase